MKGPSGFVPRESRPGLPDELADAISRLGEVSAECALENWDGIGEDGRELYRQYLSHAHTRHGRRQRCELAALQLIDPTQPLAMPPVTGG